MTPQAPYYELRDLIAISALAALFAYLTGRAHAERAAERARQRRQQARNRHGSHLNKQPTQQPTKVDTQ